MIKTKLFIATLLLMAIGTGTCFGQDIYEPNNTYETATAVTCGQQLTAYIQAEDDLDWYVIEMAESGVLEVAVTSVPANIDINVEVYQLIENALTFIADDRVGSPDYGENMFATAVMNAGTYYILVEDRWGGDFNDTDPYEMALTCTPNALELNQIYEEATLIAIDTCFEANIYGDNDLYTERQDIDWFKVEATTSGVLEVAVTSVPGNIDITVEVHQVIDNALTFISDDRVGSPDYGENMFVAAVVDPGTYLIVVQDRWDSDMNEDTYNFCSTFTPNALELNQVYDEAALISIDTCFEANIYGDNDLYTERQDIDWFKVEATSSGVLEVAVTSVPDNIDITVEVHQVIDNVLTFISDDRVGSPDYGENMFVAAVVDPGTYLIVVQDRWDSDMNEDTYNFCSTFTPNALELNQIYEEAAPIALDTCFEANIYGDNDLYTDRQDIDWFELTVTEDNYELEIAVTSVPDNIDINLAVYQVIDNVLTLIADDGVGSPDYGEDMFVSTVVDAGTYLIVVEDRWNNNMNEDTYNFCLGFTDVDENTLTSQIQVFPNPNSGHFSLKLTSESSDVKILEVGVFDYLGRETMKLYDYAINSNDISFDLTNSVKGIYVVQIKTNKGVVSKKVLVQ